MITTLLLAIATKLSDPWLTFSTTPSFDPRVTTIEVGTLSGPPKWDYWFRRIVASRSGKARQVWWTDTKRCPVAKSILWEAAKVSPPRLDFPETEEISITGDGTTYKVSGMAYYPNGTAYEMSFSSNSRTSLANWVDESLRKLDSCWSKDRP